MKNIYLLFVIGLCFFALSFKFDSGLSPMVITSLGDEPFLPPYPLSYEVNLPLNNEIFFEDTIFSYPLKSIDNSMVSIINDDVATLGRVLFYDKKLSANENMSCGSCHLQSSSFADPHPFSKGVSQLTKRNSLHLNDLGWSNNETYFWNRSKNSITSAIELPLKDDNEIGANLNDLLFKLSETTYYKNLFTNAYGDEQITEKKILEALGQFINSMNTFNSNFDKAQNKKYEFTALEKEGSKVFKNGCASCHRQGQNTILANPEDSEFLSLLIFNGYIGKNPDNGATNTPGTFPLFKIPTLRNVSKTGPYMHDGGIPDLDSLINFYANIKKDNANIGFFLSDAKLDFTQKDKEALKAFLLTLTDDSFITNPKWSDPFFKVPNLAFGNLGAEVTLFPNPFGYAASIKLPGYTNVRKEITVRNLTGQVVYLDYFYEDEHLLMKTQLTTGTYILTIKCQYKIGNYKIVVN